jgi:hypothetical protein
VLLGGGDVINILSIRTKSIINTIGKGDTKSDILASLDSGFKICGHHLMAITIAGNSIEEYDISDPYSITRIKEPFKISDYGDRNFRLNSHTKIGFHFGCQETLPLLVNDGNEIFTMIIRLGNIKPNWIR